MADMNNTDDTFGRLISGMSLEDRKSLFERLSSQSNLSQDPLYEESEDTYKEDLTAQFSRLPWYGRLACFIVSMFKSIPPDKVFEDSRVARLGKIIEVKAAGYFDRKRVVMLPAFHAALIELKTGARFFYNALDTSLNRDKGAFFGFLASLEMQELYSRLQKETDPLKFVDRHPDISEIDLRHKVFQTMDTIFESVSEQERERMYTNAHSLYSLKSLASFPFERVILSFLPDPLANGPSCPVYVVKDQLIFLNDILYSFKDSPSITLIESLFVFQLQSKEEGKNFDIDIEMRDLLSKAETSLLTFRSFNKRVPLNLILRCATHNMMLEPKLLTGGEDWFVTFQDYWRQYIEKQIVMYMWERHKKDLFESFRRFLKGRNLMFLDNAASDSNPDGITVQGTFSLSFLLTFYTVVFASDLNGLLRSILIDGDFVKREQRTSFTEGYNDLMKLESDIKEFDQSLATTGRLGKRYISALEDPSLPIRLRKTQLVIEEATETAQLIIERTRKAIDAVIVVLNAIITKDLEGNYEALSNMAHFIGKTDLSSTVSSRKETVFLNNVTETIQKLQKTIQLLDDINVVELGI
ncbi:MAG: DUF5312 domain-containing protein [Treponema sp.]|jgi:methyl-accepting chemotaxis protein|nr:DUF5312 domain-containing protein [Treponema sp.]